MFRKAPVITAAWACFALACFAQDLGERDQNIARLEQELSQAEDERARLEERLFELAWRLQELRKHKDQKAVPGLPEVELPALPDGHSWHKSGYFTGSVFIIDAAAHEAGVREASLAKALETRLAGGRQGAIALPAGVHALSGDTVELAAGKSFTLIIAVYADERNTHYAEPLVVVRPGRIDVRVRTWKNDLIRTMDYRPRLITSAVRITVDDAGRYAIDVGAGVCGRVRVAG